MSNNMPKVAKSLVG